MSVETVRQTSVILEVPTDDDQTLTEVWETLARLAASFSMRGLECQVSSSVLEYEVNYLTVGEDE